MEIGDGAENEVSCISSVVLAMDKSRLFDPGKTMGISRISMSVMAIDSGDCQGDEEQEGLVEEQTVDEVVAEGVDEDEAEVVATDVGIEEENEDGIEDGIEEQVWKGMELFEVEGLSENEKGLNAELCLIFVVLERRDCLVRRMRLHGENVRNMENDRCFKEKKKKGS